MATTPAPPTPAIQALLNALADRPAATAAQLAAAAGIGRSTAAKLLAGLAAEGRVVRQPGGRQGGRRTADHWRLPAASAETVPPPGEGSTATSAKSADAASRRPGSGRLGAGELRRLVLACLADRPGQALSPTAIAKLLDRSSGAVANALGVLAGQAAVVQTQATPRRYAIASPSVPNERRRAGRR